jgi:predicted DNA-binding transcriptional regulator YafY
LHLLAYQGNWYVLARNAEKGQIETFALSRFRGIEAAGSTFTRPADFDAQRYAGQDFGITSGEKRSRCACSSNRNWRSMSPSGNGTRARSSSSAAYILSAGIISFPVN